MCCEMKSICFERLMLCVWRLAETGVKESNNPYENREGDSGSKGLSDSPNSHLLLPFSFLLICSTKVSKRSPKLYFAHVGFLTSGLRVKHTIAINKH